jgi:hypothetical protein
MWAAELPDHLDEGERLELARLLGERVRTLYGGRREYFPRRYRDPALESESHPQD